MSFVNSWHHQRISFLFLALVTCKAYNKHDISPNIIHEVNENINGFDKKFVFGIENDVKNDKNSWDFDYHIERNNKLRVRGGKRHFDYIESNENLNGERKLGKGKRKMKQPRKKIVTKHHNGKEAKNPNGNLPISPEKTSTSINKEAPQNSNGENVIEAFETNITQVEDMDDDDDVTIDDTNFIMKQDLPPISGFENDDFIVDLIENITGTNSLSVSPTLNVSTQYPSMSLSQSPSISSTLPTSSLPSRFPSSTPSISSSFIPSSSPSSLPSLSPTISPSLSTSSVPSIEKTLKHTESPYLIGIESHEVKMPTFTVYLSAAGESDIDQDLLVTLTKEHLSVVFSQNIYFHHLDLQILETNLNRKLEFSTPKSSFFTFDGSAWFIDEKFIPKDIQTLVARSFDDYYLTSYVGQLRSSGIDAMSIYVDSSSHTSSLTSTGDMLVVEEIDESRPRNLQGIFIGFSLVVCVVILVSYTLYQREVTGIDPNYVENEDGRIDLEFEIVTCHKKTVTTHPNSSIFLERGHDNRFDVTNINSFHSDLSSFDKDESDYYYTRNAYSTTTFVEPDVSAITAETSFERQQIYEIS